MPVQTVHIQLPEAIVQRLQCVTDATHRPLEEVVVQTICANVPPVLDALRPALRDVVADLIALSAEALWAIIQEPLPPQHWRRHHHLLRQGQAGTRTSAAQQALDA